MSDRYRLITQLGAGGMAEVFAGFAHGEENFKKPVAIKRMLPQLARDPRIAKMFVAEAQLAMHLRHQNIVEVFDVGRDAAGLYVVMELVNGWDLSAILSATQLAGVRMPPPLALFIADQVASGLAHAYRQRKDGAPVIAAHRDVSPGNVMVSIDGEVKVADFGIARLGTMGQTEPGTFRGKLLYAPPEMLRGEPANMLADQFALGALLHELLTGELPYGAFESPIQQYEALTTRPPPELPGQPDNLRELIARMVAANPQARFQSVDEMLEALDGVRRQIGIAQPRDLARWLRGLQLPQTPLETLESSPAPLQLSETISLHTQPDEAFVPSGPQLDESGRLVGRTPAPSAFRPPSAPMELMAEHAPPPATNEPFTPEAIGGFQDPRYAPRAPVRAPIASAPTDAWDSSRSRSPMIRMLVIAAVLLVGAGGALLYANRNGYLHAAVQKLPGAEPAILTVESEPDGASIFVNGNEIGTTPLVRENDFPPGAEVPVTLKLKGYRSWSGHFVGGSKATIEARLRH